MAKARSRSSLKKQADALFSKFIRRRDRVCQKCYTTENLQCAHIVTRWYLATRWDPDNAVALCRGCHIFFTHRPLEWDQWVIERIGEEAYLKIKEKAIAGTKDARAFIDYEAIIYRLKKALA